MLRPRGSGNRIASAASQATASATDFVGAMLRFTSRSRALTFRLAACRGKSLDPAGGGFKMMPQQHNHWGGRIWASTRKRRGRRCAPVDVSRRSFLTTGAAGVGAAALTGIAAQDANAQAGIRWDHTADVVIVGAGVAGLPAAITARDLGASVIVVEENFDIGGRGMLSGGRVQLGGGTALQQKFNIKDNADQVFLDWVRHDDGESRYSDRDLVRVYRRRERRDLQLPDRERRRVHREADRSGRRLDACRASSSPRNGTSRAR